MKKNCYFKFVISGVAVLVLVISSFVVLPKLMKTNSGLQAKVLYPKAYAHGSQELYQVRDDNPVDASFLKDLNLFSYQTASKLFVDNEQLNYSPLSLYYALAMASTGSQGDTAKEFQALLGQRSMEDLSKECGNLYRQLYRKNDITELKLANSLWLAKASDSQNTVFEPAFLNNEAKHFYASSHLVDFSSPSAGKAIGEWISTETNHSLEPKIKTTGDELMTLINTVYYKGQWEDQFDQGKTAEDLFTSSNGKQSKRSFMNRILSGSFCQGDNYISASLDLKDDCSMVFILPNEGTSIKELTSSPETLQKIFEAQATDSGLITWKVPKMDFSSSLDLNETLNSLGLTSAFNINTANFSGMTKSPLFISTVKQDTQISVNEDGVTASAYTLIQMPGSALPTKNAKMILDRPFLYSITATNGTLLFIGSYDLP